MLRGKAFLRFALLVVCVLLSAGCTTLSGKRMVYQYAPDYGVEDPAFRRSLESLGTRMVPNNHVQLLENGEGFFPAMLEAMRQAKHSINVEMYIFSDDTIGAEFASVMAAKAREGVEVRLLVDDIGSDLDWLEDKLALSGAKVYIYKPLRIYSIHKVSERTHRKLLIVDGRVGFIGGLGVDERWQGNGRCPHEWRELVARVEGPVVSQLQAIFMEDWLHTTGEVLHGPGQFPALETPGHGVLAQAIRSSRTDSSSLSKLHYYMAIQAARKRIWIQNAYFVPDRQIRQALIDAVKRGVDVRVMVPGEYTDLAFVRAASRFLYSELLDGGVKLYEYRPTMLHSKVMVVDGVWTAIGSINFVSRSMRANAEANLAVYDAAFAARVEREFQEDLVYCEAFKKRKWERRGPLVRVGEAVAWLFSEAY